MLSLGRVLRRRGHIRVNILRDALDARARRRIDAVTTFAAIVWTVALAWGGASLALDAWQVDLRSESALQAPLFAPYLLVPAGSILLLIALVRQLAGILKGIEPSRPPA